MTQKQVDEENLRRLLQECAEDHHHDPVTRQNRRDEVAVIQGRLGKPTETI